MTSKSKKVLVVGSGAIGLATAQELLRRRIHVSLVSPKHPLHPSTCSMGAGGLWMPFHCDDPRTDRWAFETLKELNNFSSQPSLVEGSEALSASKLVCRPRHGSLVEILPAVVLMRNRETPIPSWATDAAKSTSLAFQRLSIDGLYEESRSLRFRLPRRDVVEGVGYSHAWMFRAPVVDAPKMLMHMLEEVKTNQFTDHVDVETNKYYASIEEMTEEARALGCDGLVNCTGMGSRRLCDDASLIGARGVLLHYDRAACAWTEEREGGRADGTVVQDSAVMIEDPPYGSDVLPCYMIPRGDVLAVGGSYLEGDEEGGLRASERARVIENAKILGVDVETSTPVGEWVGFRPYRPTVRLEADDGASSTGGVEVVHSYGHGGSGWTVYVGAAREAAALMERRWAARAAA